VDFSILPLSLQYDAVKNDVHERSP